MDRIHCMSVALLLIGFGSIVAAPVPKAIKNQNSLEGIWEVTEWYSAGRKVNAGNTITRWTVQGDTLTIDRQVGNGAVARPVNGPSYKLERTEAAEKAVDYTINYANNGRTITYPGLYEVDGDTLKFCYALRGTDRPTECQEGPSNVLYLFKRVAADDKKK